MTLPLGSNDPGANALQSGHQTNFAQTPDGLTQSVPGDAELFAQLGFRQQQRPHRVMALPYLAGEEFADLLVSGQADGKNVRVFRHEGLANGRRTLATVCSLTGSG